jgi:hypothetical protein
MQHSQLPVVEAVDTPCNLHITTAIPILLSDSQNNTHNFSTNKTAVNNL